MLIPEDERTLLRERVKNVRDSGGVAAIARKGKLSRVTIYKILDGSRDIRPLTIKQMKKGLKQVEAQKGRALSA